jgi:L-idonate 5-dehydrogenase
MVPVAVQTELPSTTLAVVAHAAGDLRLDDVPLGSPAPGEAVVEVVYGGICGSDLHYWLHGAAGESVLKAPLVLGHEIVGSVVHAAADGSGPLPGTPVAVHPASPAAGAARYPEDRPNRTRKTGQTSRPAAPTSAARPGSRIRTAPSAAMCAFPRACCGLSRRTSTSGRRR